MYYNEMAWLVANTEGDVDEAVRLSHKSVELVRAEAASDADFSAASDSSPGIRSNAIRASSRALLFDSKAAIAPTDSAAPISESIHKTSR